VVERLVDVVRVVAEPVVPVVQVTGAAQREVRGVEVGAQFGPVVVEVVVAGQVGLGRVDRRELRVVQPAGPGRVENLLRALRAGACGSAGGPALPAFGKLVDRVVVVVTGPAGGNDRIR
jgi:hypothetical protein